MEENWVERAQQGELEAVAELYRRYWRAARAAAYGVTGDLSLAEDAASEAFCAAMSSLVNLRDPDRFGPWLRTIVVRTARRFKAAQCRDVNPLPLAKSQAAGPGERLERQELAALIREAVGSLPEELREAISLHYFEGYSVEDAARFLGIPAGTFKRRLFDGRQRLRSAAERIVQGSTPMKEPSERILEELHAAFDQGLGSDAFYQMIRKAAHLGPAPRESLRDLLRKHMEAKLPKEGPALSPEQERTVREALRQVHEPSERARDPNHPVGAVANAIRAALPEFGPWQVDLSQVNLAEKARRLFDNRTEALSYLLPPRFVEESRGAYVCAERDLLIRDQDGSVLTMGELMARKATQEAFREQMKTGGCMSDTLGLLWRQPEPLDLRAIEELLRRLSGRIVPEAPVQFRTCEEPRYRAVLRMQLGDSPIPAAIGGVLNPWSILPEDAHLGSITIYLEPWASIRSGQTIEPAEGTPFPSLRSPTPATERRSDQSARTAG